MIWFVGKHINIENISSDDVVYKHKRYQFLNSETVSFILIYFLPSSYFLPFFLVFLRGINGQEIKWKLTRNGWSSIGLFHLPLKFWKLIIHFAYSDFSVCNTNSSFWTHFVSFWCGMEERFLETTDEWKTWIWENNLFVIDGWIPCVNHKVSVLLLLILPPGCTIPVVDTIVNCVLIFGTFWNFLIELMIIILMIMMMGRILFSVCPVWVWTLPLKITSSNDWNESSVIQVLSF